MHSIAFSVMLHAQAAPGGEGFDALAASLPTHPGAIFVLVVAFAAIGVTIYYGRSNNHAPGAPREGSGPARSDRAGGESSHGADI